MVNDIWLRKKNILFQTELISNKKESICGIKKWNNFILQNIISSNKKVSDWNTIWLAYLNVIDHKDQLKIETAIVRCLIKRTEVMRFRFYRHKERWYNISLEVWFTYKE